MLSAFTVAATNSPKGDSYFYYELGGGEKITIPPGPITTTIHVSLLAQYSGLSCGKFDPVVSITNSLNNIQQGLDNALNQVEAAASAAIANLPGYILLKANPGLYDLFQNGLLRASQQFTLSTKSCETMRAEMNRGKDPYAEWISLSAGDQWRRSMGTAGITDINEVKTDIEENQGESGIPWIGNRRQGGRHQDPIRLFKDVVRAGYNINLSRDANDTSSIPVPAVTPNPSPDSSSIQPPFPEFVRRWNSPQPVETWVEEVIGEKVITTCDGCEKSTIPGRGLLPKIHETTLDIKRTLTDIVIGAPAGIEPIKTNLDQVSAPGINTTVHLIEAIRAIPDDVERGTVVNALSTEVSVARLVEEAILIRRLLLTGKKEVHVQSSGVAVKEVDKAVEELEKEINHLVYEETIRKTFVTDTIKTVLAQAKRIEEQSRLIPPVPLKDPYQYRDFHIKPQPSP